MNLLIYLALLAALPAWQGTWGTRAGRCFTRSYPQQDTINTVCILDLEYFEAKVRTTQCSYFQNEGGGFQHINYAGASGPLHTYTNYNTTQPLLRFQSYATGCIAPMLDFSSVPMFSGPIGTEVVRWGLNSPGNHFFGGYVTGGNGIFIDHGSDTGAGGTNDTASQAVVLQNNTSALGTALYLLGESKYRFSTLLHINSVGKDRLIVTHQDSLDKPALTSRNSNLHGAATDSSMWYWWGPDCGKIRISGGTFISEFRLSGDTLIVNGKRFIAE